MFAPVDPVNYSKPYLHGALILQVITSLRELGSGHVRLYITKPQTALKTRPLTGSIGCWHCLY